MKMIICLHLHFYFYFFSKSAATQTTKAQRRHQHPARRRKVTATNNTRRMWSTSRCRAQKLLCTSQVLLSLPVGTPGNSMYIACSSCAHVERTAASLRGNVSGGKSREGFSKFRLENPRLQSEIRWSELKVEDGVAAR